MAENEKNVKKSAGEKKPVPFRIEQETADKIRELAKEFSNQDAALNALMAAYERERLAIAEPAYAEDIRQFEEYQRFLGAKYTTMLNALSTADARARTEVQQLLHSKDVTIQQMQEQMEKAKSGRETYERMYAEAQAEKRRLEEELEKEQRLVAQIRDEMLEKEEKFRAALGDKERLNDILTSNLEEKQKELDAFCGYPAQMAEKDGQIKELSRQVQELEGRIKEADYEHRMELLEKERQMEAEKAQVRKELSDEMAALRTKYEEKMESLRDRYEQMQFRAQATENS